MRLLNNFSRDERGAIAIIFAVSLVPLLGLAGAAIDYTHATHRGAKEAYRPRIFPRCQLVVTPIIDTKQRPQHTPGAP